MKQGSFSSTYKINQNRMEADHVQQIQFTARFGASYNNFMITMPDVKTR